MPSIVLYHLYLPKILKSYMTLIKCTILSIYNFTIQTLKLQHATCLYSFLVIFRPYILIRPMFKNYIVFNPLNPELNPICYLLALLRVHHFLHVSRIRVKLLTFRLLMSYIYGAPILDVSRSHTTTQHSR